MSKEARRHQQQNRSFLILPLAARWSRRGYRRARGVGQQRGPSPPLAHGGTIPFGVLSASHLSKASAGQRVTLGPYLVPAGNRQSRIRRRKVETDILRRAATSAARRRDSLFMMEVLFWKLRNAAGFQARPSVFCHPHQHCASHEGKSTNTF